jgi:hypothetical protein
MKHETLTHYLDKAGVGIEASSNKLFIRGRSVQKNISPEVALAAALMGVDPVILVNAARPESNGPSIYLVSVIRELGECNDMEMTNPLEWPQAYNYKVLNAQSAVLMHLNYDDVQTFIDGEDVEAQRLAEEHELKELYYFLNIIFDADSGAFYRKPGYVDDFLKNKETESGQPDSEA